MDRPALPEPSRRRKAAGWIRRPLERILAIEAGGGIVLLAAAAVALIWANSPWSGAYARLCHAAVPVGFGRFRLDGSLRFWINDGWMTLFFVVIGVEIRRGLRGGARGDLRRALLPAVAAAGGMLIPALIYRGWNAGAPVRRGWGIPTATDVAFALGVLALLGKRVTPAMRVFLLTLATVDDIGSMAVVAILYPTGLSAAGLAIAAAGILLLAALRHMRVRQLPAYLVPGGIVWLGALRAGIHPAIAGVPMGLLVPVEAGEVLQPWVAYAITPLFALANAGIGIRGLAWQHEGARSVLAGVLLGRVLGKPAGIMLAARAAVRTRICVLPRDMSWRGVLVIGCLGGIGLTVPIYIAGIAFSDEALLSASKLALLLASAVSSVLGLAIGRLVLSSASR